MNAAMIYLGTSDGGKLSHSVHQSWADAIEADELIVRQLGLPAPFRGSVLGDIGTIREALETDHDVYIFENPRTLYAAPRIRRQNPDSILIYLEANWRLHGTSSYNFRNMGYFRKSLKWVYRATETRVLRRILRNHVDGIIAVSELMARLCREITDVPVEIVEPFVNDDLRARLLQADPSLTNKSAVVVCTHRDHKGIDILVDAWRSLSSEIPGATLRIAGKNHPSRYEDIDGIEVLGFVDDLKQLFETSDVYIHPARLDPCPVSPVEAMVAGLPAIVTRTTGSKSVVQSVDPTLITSPNPAAIEQSLREYFAKDTSERRAIGTAARQVAKERHQKSNACDFPRGIQNLVQEIREHQ